MTAPQTKIDQKMPSGIIDQVTSSAVEPSICSAWDVRAMPVLEREDSNHGEDQPRT